MPFADALKIWWAKTVVDLVISAGFLVLCGIVFGGAYLYLSWQDRKKGVKRAR